MSLHQLLRCVHFDDSHCTLLTSSCIYLPLGRLQRNFVFVVLIDCALSKLLAEGSIVVAEIFVFSRAIEDVVDLLLIRSRSESELATLMT